MTMENAQKTYSVIASSVTVWFNKYGSHDHNGLMYILEEYKPIIDYVKKIQKYDENVENAESVFQGLMEQRNDLICEFDLTNQNRINEWLPDSAEKAKKPHPLIVPLVLRARKGESIRVKLKNEIENRSVGIHLIGPGTDIQSDGSDIWDNPNSLVSYNHTKIYEWDCQHEGVYVFHDAGDFRGDEKGTNTHGLFGALIVEPENTRWTDPENKSIPLHSGLYADVHFKAEADITEAEKAPYPVRDNLISPNPTALTTPYPRKGSSFREYVIFFHDEPEWVAPHKAPQPNPCAPEAVLDHTAGSLMPISYRAEPMIDREQLLWKMMEDGLIDPENTVVNEEQHHSCWLFGNPDTPVLNAYLGDPFRIRLVHAGVKETHVFHLHVYEWNAIPEDLNSNIIDAITISPQTGHTIMPLYGAGNRQMVPGDVIWHCHLYPHFHHGMWGIFRIFDRMQDGISGEKFNGDTGERLSQAGYDAMTRKEKNRYARQLGHYPDGSVLNRLEPLPDRLPPPSQDLDNKKLGYPHFISGEIGQKSFIPPWHKDMSSAETDGWAIADYDYRQPTEIEKNAFNIDPKPGELFTCFPHNDSSHSVHVNHDTGELLNTSETIEQDIDVLMTPIKYNEQGWWDPHGHLFALAGHDIKTFSEVVHESFHHAVAHKKEADETLNDEEAKELVKSEGLTLEPIAQDPMFFRCNKTNVMQLTLHNRLERHIAATPFDSAWPKGKELGCEKFAKNKGECGMHVHIVKFDPIACDGASTGWNYISAPQIGKKMVYRWWADEEFGTIFSHDHCFANFRQKHGLYAALLVEPENSTFHHPDDFLEEILAGTQAVIKYTDESGKETAYREFCMANGDWVPLFKLADGDNENENVLGGHHENDGGADGQFTAVSPYVAHDLLDHIKVRYGIPIEAPEHPDSHDDNGVFSVNYKCEPLAERPYDPSEWFNSKEFLVEGEHGSENLKVQYGDPSTPMFRTLAGDPIRIRLMQGSHEEQHSFQIHGMRWNRFWKDENSPLRNQQTIGVSEVFTFDILEGRKQNYVPGDYLWKFSSAEDLWLGAWGLIRSYDQTSNNDQKPLALPNSITPVDIAHPPLIQCRRFRIKAVAKNINYSPVVSDPYGLVYQLIAVAEPSGDFVEVCPSNDKLEPLVLRCQKGDWIAVEVINDIPAENEVEPMAPQLPHNDKERTVSNKVSLHADLLHYDVKSSDGSNVGNNPDTTIENASSHTYFWHADEEVGPVLLQDMADFRNHRHHGLIGAIVVHPSGTVPYKVSMLGATSSLMPKNIQWHGARVTLACENGKIVEDKVLFLQDGLRYYLNGNPALPIGDFPADPGEETPDTEDQGLKGFNYGSEPTSHLRGYKFAPATPIIKVEANANVQIHMVGACDKPRNHTFTLHGHSWKEWEHLHHIDSPRMSSEGGISSGFVKTYRFNANDSLGNYMYRSGVLKYVVEQGLWGVLQVVGCELDITNKAV